MAEDKREDGKAGRRTTAGASPEGASPDWAGPWPEETEVYRVGLWAGLPNFVCKTCPEGAEFASLDADNTIDHHNRVHVEAPLIATPNPVILDARGRRFPAREE